MNPKSVRVLLTLTTTVCMLALISCSEENATSPVQNGDNVTTTGLQKQASRYLIEYTGKIDRAKAYVRALGGVIEDEFRQVDLLSVSGLNDQAAAQLLNKPGITSYTRDSYEQYVPSSSSLGSVCISAASGAANPTGDPFSAPAYLAGQQWGLDAINAPAAWQITTGNSDVRVGVLDSGIRPDHPDLKDRYDLTKSRNFSTSSPNDPNAYIDYLGHGTFVSGIISTNNIEVAGVAPDITMVGIKILSNQGSGYQANVIAGILYAADQGACDIINLSIGSYFTKRQNGRYLSRIQRAVNYARSKGVLVVCSAGNASIDLDHNGPLMVGPGQTAGAMMISATAPQNGVNPDTPAKYTNYGRSAINIAAPGGAGPRYGGAANYTDCIRSCWPPDTYAWWIGTSFSAPHVAGAAALVESKTGNSNPGFLKARLQNSADDCGAPGVDPYFGKGRLNAGNALQ